MAVDITEYSGIYIFLIGNIYAKNVAGSTLCWTLISMLACLQYINVQHWGGLSMALLQQEKTMELFVKRREFIPDSGSLSPCDITYIIRLRAM